MGKIGINIVRVIARCRVHLDIHWQALVAKFAHGGFLACTCFRVMRARPDMAARGRTGDALRTSTAYETISAAPCIGEESCQFSSRARSCGMIELDR
jgi:hypothetical protein